MSAADENKDPRLAGAGQGPGTKVNLLQEFRKDASGYGTAQAGLGKDHGDYPSARGGRGPEDEPAAAAWQVVTGKVPEHGDAEAQRDG